MYNRKFIGFNFEVLLLNNDCQVHAPYLFKPMHLQCLLGSIVGKVICKLWSSHMHIKLAMYLDTRNW